MRQFISAIFLCLLAFGLVAQDAEAKRLGGGASRGMQRDMGNPQGNPRPPEATPSGSAAQPAATPSGSANPAPPRKNWLGPLAGLAAGLGIGALLSHFGLSEVLADLLVIVLLVVAAIAILKFLFRRKAAAPNPDDTLPLQYAGVGGPHLTPLGAALPVAPPATAPTRPATPLVRNIAPGFDVESFLHIAKTQFVRLQAANDAGNVNELREFTTPAMLAEFQADIDRRHGLTQRTEVVTLEAELLEVIAEGDGHIAGIRFHGTIRQDGAGAAQPFDEVWHLARPADGSHGWVLAGIQLLN